MKGIIVIPARLESSRLPNKLLLNETGKPLIQHTIDCARVACKSYPEVFTREPIVATDSKEIADVCDCDVVMTRSHYINGTERVGGFLFDEQNDVDLDSLDFVFILQADEPDLCPICFSLCMMHMSFDGFDMSTLVLSHVKTNEAYKDQNVVKVALSNFNRPLYFSRSSNPFGLTSLYHWYSHIGVYAYKLEALRKYVDYGPLLLEKAENLEQLRALELGMNLRASIVPNYNAGISVNTREDYDKFVEKHKSQKGD